MACMVTKQGMLALLNRINKPFCGINFLFDKHDSFFLLFIFHAAFSIRSKHFFKRIADA